MVQITCLSKFLLLYDQHCHLLYYFFVIIDILKYFNQNLTGYSVGMGKQQNPKAFLNQAVAGAKSEWVPPEAFSAESVLL